MKDQIKDIDNEVSSGHYSDWRDVTPEMQIETAKKCISKYHWNFKESEIPKSPVSTINLGPNEILLLAIYFDTNRETPAIIRTILKHLDVIRDQLLEQEIILFYRNELYDYINCIDRRQSTKPKGFRWVAYDYAYGFRNDDDQRVINLSEKLDNNKRFASSELLSALIMFPKYGPSMDGLVTPCVNMVGYETIGNIAISFEWRHRDKHIAIFTHTKLHCNNRWATPTVRDL